MMFAAMFIVFILFIILASSVVGFLISGSLLIVFCVKSKRNGGHRLGKIVCTVFTCIFGFPILIALIILCISLHSLTIIPEDYIDCEKITYTDGGFVSDSGEEFVRLDLGGNGYLLYVEPYTRLTAEYSYAPSGRYNRSSWYNIYGHENGSGCKLYIRRVENSGEAFYYYAKADEAEALTSYYKNNYFWCLKDYSENWDEEFMLPEELVDILEKYTGREDYQEISNFDSFGNTLYAVSSDYVLTVYRYELYIENDGLSYLKIKSEYTSENYYVYYGFVLSKEESQYINEFYSSLDQYLNDFYGIND